MSQESVPTEKVLEVLADFANALLAATVNLRHQICRLVGIKGAVAVKEETFTILKFEKQEGSHIGQFEVAYREQNLSDKWNSAYNVLRMNNSIIGNRYYGDSYVHSYWIYGEGKIYRQKRKNRA